MWILIEFKMKINKTISYGEKFCNNSNKSRVNFILAAKNRRQSGANSASPFATRNIGPRLTLKAAYLDKYPKILVEYLIVKKEIISGLFINNKPLFY